MRLTATMREQFVHNVMGDVPKTDYAKLSRELVQKDAEGKLPAAIRKIYDDKDLRPYLASERVYFERFCYMNIHTPIGYTIPDHIQAKLSELLDQYDKQNNAISEARKNLKAIAESCTTVEALKRQLPEFEKYIPEPPQKAFKELPMITTLVSDLTKMGWPASVQTA